MNADDLIKRNMEDVHQKELAGKKFGNREEHQSRVIIIACISPWVDPADIFNLLPGDAYVIRNAGNIVTQDTMRSIMLALLKDKITDIIVLGHLECTNANISIVKANYRTLADKLPPNSAYSPLISTEEKAMKYFMIFRNEFDNVITQVDNLRFLKTIQPSTNISGMIYNAMNGHVYTFAELKEMKKLLEKNPNERINAIIPKRYKEFVKNQAHGGKIVSRTGHDLPPSKKNVMKSEENLESSEIAPTGTDVDVPAPIHPQEIIHSKKDVASENFDMMVKLAEKSIAKMTKVRVFVPKIRIPQFRPLRSIATKDSTT